MTDQTQEAMRVAFALYCDNLRNQRQVLHHATNLDLWRDNGASFEAGYKACAAQSAEKIARLEEDIAQMTRAYTDSADEYEQQLASAELSNGQLREALLRMADVADNKFATRREMVVAINHARDACAQQPSTEALDAYVAKLTKWQPIETAPKDGTVIDLLIDGERITDCYWGLPNHSCGEQGRYCDSDWHSLSDYWTCSIFNEQLGEGATHWMPLPPAPEDGD